MDCSLSSILITSYKLPPFSTHRSINISPRSLVVIATASCSYRNSGLHAPLELKTEEGRLLSGVFMNNREDFKLSAKKVLEKVGFQRDQALARRDFSIVSDEAFLHRRIAELKDLECQTAVEDIMYLMIVSKFSEIKVHLIPRLSRCIYNGRLEILPSKDWQLESIHTFEFLEMIRDHLATVVGWRCNSNVKDSWATTKIPRLPLCQIYAASILYGYFLKSALLRHHLEQSLHIGRHLESRKISFGHRGGLQSTSIGEVSCPEKAGRLKGYVMRFDTETMNLCAKPWSRESVNLIKRHSNALFGESKDLVECDEMICTSFAFCNAEEVCFGRHCIRFISVGDRGICEYCI